MLWVLVFISYPLSFILRYHCWRNNLWKILSYSTFEWKVLAGWHCVGLPCCMPGLGYTLVPMPSRSILRWLASHAACPSSWVQRFAHERAQWEGKKGGLVLFIKILNQETLLVFLFIAPPKLVLYLFEVAMITIWRMETRMHLISYEGGQGGQSYLQVCYS